MQDILEHYVFITGSSSHLTLFEDCVFNGVKKSFLQLNVGIFCEDICKATEKWLSASSSNPNVQARLKDTIELHQPGYVYMGLIRFS